MRIQRDAIMAFGPPTPRPRAALGAGLLLGVAALTGCAGGAVAPRVATFEIEGETFRIELATPELVSHAEGLLAGEDLAPIPVGRIVRDSPSVNSPWSWHLDPATIEFADMTTEVCDGLPAFVEDGTLTGEYYCPWGARLIAIDQLP